jgi:hypothetical protein
MSPRSPTCYGTSPSGRSASWGFLAARGASGSAKCRCADRPFLGNSSVPIPKFASFCSPLVCANFGLDRY